MNPWLLNLGWAAAACALVMTLTYALSRRWRNAGIVDVVWAGGFAFLAAGYAVASPAPEFRRWVVAGLVGFWSLRLSWHLARRVAHEHPAEDGRYADLRREWGRRAEVRMFGFFQLQGALMVLLSVPFLLAARNPAPTVHPLEWAGGFLLLLALAGESLADHQLRRFKSRVDSPGQVCREGLWRYSRHPNYFFEWLVWVAFALLAWPAPYGWFAVLCPALILHFLLNVTGVPATEAQALRSRPVAYRDYQRTTNAFFPWFPRNTPSDAR